MTDILIEKEFFKKILNSINKMDLIKLFAPDDVVFKRWNSLLPKQTVIEEIIIRCRKDNLNSHEIAYCKFCKMIKKINVNGYCDECDKAEEKPRFS